MNLHGKVRPPAVAGLFYPGDPGTLAETVDQLLVRADDDSAPTPAPTALVVPHAGYIYSGPIAARAYRRILGSRDQIHRVVILGPAHRALLRGMAVPTVDAFATPLGEIPIDDDLRFRSYRVGGVVADDRPHQEEHSIEVHLPFLQRILGATGWTVLPVVVGQASADQVAALLSEVWDDPGTLVVVSTDLSHYEPYDSARDHDARTAAEILARRYEAIEPLDACGARPLSGLLELARRRQLGLELIDLRNSGDTAGDRSRVVGYGAFAVSDA